MKNLHLLKLILLIAVCFSGTLSVAAQTTNIVRDTAYIYPENPSEKDSVYMTYVYLSTDGCPDYFLKKDSVAPGKIYVSLNKIPDMGRPCTTVMTWFKALINLGTITGTTEIYFNGKLYKTIAPCKMEKTGVVIACGRTLYIQEFSPLAVRQLYTFNNTTYNDSSGRIFTKPQAGDTVRFSGILSSNIPAPEPLCRPVGKVICYQIINTTPPVVDPPCVMDKSGIVVKCQDRLYFEDTSTPYASPMAQLYFIKGITDNNTGINPKVKEGDKVKFGGYPLKLDTASNYCRTVGIALCFRLIDSIQPCVLDKKGIVEEGIDGCTGQLFIREILTRNLYTIKVPAISNSSTTVNTLKPGDKVVFGGYLLHNDSNKVSLCPVAGVATCYRLIETAPPCIMDKEGIIERGTDACSSLLFVRETTSQNLYFIKNGNMIYADGTAVRNLNPGDKVKFGATPINTLVYDANLCNAVGIVNCYVITLSADTLSLSGVALAGNDTVKSGMVILFEKGYRKSAALSTIREGTFTFGRLHPGAYTVYVIPDRELYRNYLPTFYIDKLYYKTADFIELNKTNVEVAVKMRYYDRKTGSGKIFGNIYYESYRLNDSLMVKNALLSTEGIANYNLAVNTTVILFNRANAPVAWTLTDVNGNYVFTDIPLDTYTVEAETASAYASTGVALSTENSIANRDLVMKNNDGVTGWNVAENTVLNLFPNPVRNKLSVTMAQQAEISVYNLNGQLHIRQQLNAGSNTLDMSSMPAGVYIVRIGGKSYKLIKY